MKTWAGQFAQDVRFATRDLWRHRGFAATAILTLALATGATTAIFSVVNGVLLRPLPFRDPDRLVTVSGRNWREDRGAPDALTGPVAGRELTAYNVSGSFEGFAAYDVTTTLLQGDAGLERLNAARTELTLFSVLGADALAGRTFQPGDPLDVAVISESLWRRRFDRDPAAIGRRITLDGAPFTIVGVMPARFQFPFRSASLLPGALPESRTEVWFPTSRRGRSPVVARLKPGVSIDAAGAELAGVAAQLEQEDRVRFPDQRFRVGVRLRPLGDVVVAPVRGSLWLLFAAVGVVLAAACANVANLLLARIGARTTEILTRAALGAGPGRLARQFFAESLLLSIAGGALGFWIARWGTALLTARIAARIPRTHEISVDWQAFVFLLVACVATAFVFGLAPALTAARMDAHGIARSAGARTTSGPLFRFIRDGLVVVEVALAFVLATGIALILRESNRLEHVPLGFTPENVVTLHLTPKLQPADYYAIEARVSQLPGVRAAGFTQMLPLQNWGWEAGFTIKGRPPAAAPPRCELRYVTPGYFRALGIPILRGRSFTLDDSAAAPKVIVINDALAREYFPGEDPVGRELDRGRIIGVAGDVRQIGLDRPAVPEIYFPAAQNLALTTDMGLTLVAAGSAQQPRVDLDAIRGVVRSVAPNVAIFNVKAMPQVVADSLWQLDLYRRLIGLFAALAVGLAAIGLYGVIAYTTNVRATEFAIRMALGSGPGAVWRLVIGRGLALAIAGLATGAVGVAAASRLIASLGTWPIASQPNPATLTATGLLVLLVSLAACAVPAARAARTDPAVALRQG